VTTPQLLFVAGLVAVLVAILGFAILVVSAAARNTGDSADPAGVLRRLSRAPRDRLELGRWAFWAHRVSGVAIFAFLALHLVDVAAYAVSPALYDEIHVLYGTLGMRLFESGLLFAILFHALNGLRLLAIDLVDVGARTIAGLLVAVVVATLVIGAWGSAVILAPVGGIGG
jgi:succinate dehydrogenase / fumarate reductase, cytochrome b subunit